MVVICCLRETDIKVVVKVVREGAKNVRRESGDTITRRTVGNSEFYPG